MGTTVILEALQANVLGCYVYLGRCHQAIAMEALQAKTTDILGCGCHLRKLENMIEMCSYLKGFQNHSHVCNKF